MSDFLGTLLVKYKIPTINHPICGHYINSKRFLPYYLPPNAQYLLNNFNETFRTQFQPEDTDTVNWLIKNLEKMLEDRNIFIKLQPGDYFRPIVFVNSAYLKTREVFDIFTDYIKFLSNEDSISWIVNERLANKVGQANFPSMQVNLIDEIESWFFPENADKFYTLKSSEPDNWDKDLKREKGYIDFLLEEAGLIDKVEELTCEHCGSKTYNYDNIDKNYWDKISDEKYIEFSKKYTTFRRKKIIPQSHIPPNVVMFHSPMPKSISNEIWVRQEMMDLLSDIDLSFATITEFTVI
jgi:hypothetical protein